MKKPRLSSLACTGAACAVLWLSVMTNPPGGVSWHAFAVEDTALALKLRYLAGVYILPALLAFVGIVLFQLQFRISMSGARAAVVFASGVLGATAMLGGFRALAMAPNSLPGYVLGMALGYTVMARLYAIRMRTLWGRVRMPWVVWRGNAAAVSEIDRQMAARARGGAPAGGSTA